MIPENWQRIREVMERGRELPPPERSDWLDSQLGPDGEDREFVDALLEAENIDDDFLLTPNDGGPARATFEPARPVGTQVESFQIRRLIASGGMGAVYEAEQQNPKRRVALKMMHAGTHSPASLRRFVDEAELLARLKHPGIAQVYEAGVLPAQEDGSEGETPWFALELVEGARPITTHSKEEKLSLRSRIEIFLTVCDAVHHGHQRSIVHRDLKPANILVDRAGRPKVIDFGIAKVTDRHPGEATDHTLPGEIVGTLMYMSPEQVDGRTEDVDTRTDAYALGVVLYELTCDVAPFDLAQRSITEAARMLSTQDPPPPSSRAQEVPVDLDWIVAKAMAKDLDQRYRSVAELADDLGRLLRHEPVSAGPPSATYQLRKFVRRHRAGVAATLLASLAVVGGLVGTSLGLVRAVHAEEVAEGERLIAVSEADKATAVVDFLIDVLSSPDPSVAGRDVRVMDVLSRAAEEYGVQFVDQPDVRARLAHALGSVYRGLGLRGESSEELVRALDFMRALHDGPHPETALVLGNLGVVLLDEGDYVSAEEHLSESLAMEEQLAPESESLYRAYIRMGRLRLGQAHVAEAEELLRAGLEGLQDTVDEESRDLLIAKNVLAGALHQSMQLDEAESLYRASLDGLRRTLGEGHPDTIRVRFNLAMLRHSRGESAASIEEIKELLEIRRETLGPDHPDTLMTIMNLAGMLQMAGRLDESADVYAASYDEITELLPQAHPIQQTLRVNMGQLARARGDLAEAEELLSSVYEARVEAVGPTNERTLRVLYELTSIARESRHHDLAEERALRGLENAEASTEAPPHYVYLFQLELGQAWTHLRSFEDAEQVLLDSLQSFAQIDKTHLLALPPPQPALARLYQSWGKPELAAEY